MQLHSFLICVAFSYKSAVILIFVPMCLYVHLSIVQMYVYILNVIHAY